MKFINPLHYPIAVLIGSIVLFIGARFIQLPNIIILPVAIGIILVSAIYFQQREAKALNLENRELEREIKTVNNSALILASQAKEVLLEAAKILTDTFQVDLLATLQISCGQVLEAPNKIDTFLRRLQNSKSLLSVQDLQQQLSEVERKILATGSNKRHLSELAESLRRNIKLAKEGRDTRLVQVYSVSTQIQNSAGILQQIQNQLVNLNTNDYQKNQELQLLANQLANSQENLDLLIR